MRFTLIKNITQDTLMVPILSGLLLFSLLYLVADVAVKYSGFGLFKESINLTLFGDEEQFIDPLTSSSFLEFWHMEIFFIMMLLFTLSALYIRLSHAGKADLIIVNTTMLSAFGTLVFLFVSFYTSVNLLELYVACFFLWHILAVYMSIYSLWRLHCDTGI